MANAKFHAMTEGTQEDWQIIATEFQAFCGKLQERVLAHMQLLSGDFGGFAVDRLEHCLQTATRAHRDGRDEEYVACALLHDLGDVLAPANHPDVAAAILYPYVSEENYWMVKHHGIFQGYYFLHFAGLERDLRDQYRDSPHFQHTVDFCHKYDQAAFDPNYDSEPLEFFAPMLKRVLATPKRSIYDALK